MTHTSKLLALLAVALVLPSHACNEPHCPGVPVSHLDAVTGKVAYGVPLTTSQLVDTAIARFNAALGVAAAVSNATLRQTMTNLANVGKARALADSGDFAGAAATVSSVPTSFAYLSEHSEISTYENNGVFNGNTQDRRYSVADREGGNGFPFRSVIDPRTPSRRRTAGNRNGFDGLTPQFNNFRFGDRKSPIPLATGVEARLIEAEAALQADTVNPSAAFLTALNDPRANPASRSYFNASPFSRTDTVTNPIPVLPNLTAADATTAGGAVNLLFNERARW